MIGHIGRRRSHGPGLLALSLLLPLCGCSHPAATPPPPASAPVSPAAAAQSQQTEQQFLQSDPSMPAAEKAGIEAQMRAHPPQAQPSSNGQ